MTSSSPLDVLDASSPLLMAVIPLPFPPSSLRFGLPDLSADAPSVRPDEPPVKAANLRLIRLQHVEQHLLTSGPIYKLRVDGSVGHKSQT